MRCEDTLYGHFPPLPMMILLFSLGGVVAARVYASLSLSFTDSLSNILPFSFRLFPLDFLCSISIILMCIYTYALFAMIVLVIHIGFFTLVIIGNRICFSISR